MGYLIVSNLFILKVLAVTFVQHCPKRHGGEIKKAKQIYRNQVEPDIKVIRIICFPIEIHGKNNVIVRKLAPLLGLGFPFNLSLVL